MTERSEGDKTLYEHKILSTGQAIAYGLPNAGLQAILGILVSFTLLFYINIMGQPPILVGGIFSAGLVFYAIMCIIGGAIADKVGKKKVMLISGPLAELFGIPLLFIIVLYLQFASVVITWYFTDIKKIIHEESKLEKIAKEEEIRLRPEQIEL